MIMGHHIEHFSQHLIVAVLVTMMHGSTVVSQCIFTFIKTIVVVIHIFDGCL